jgi:hypothetical protein
LLNIRLDEISDSMNDDTALTSAKGRPRWEGSPRSRYGSIDFGLATARNIAQWRAIDGGDVSESARRC